MIQENLKKYREEKGYSKLKLAKEAKLNRKTIEMIENEKIANPSINTLEKIVNVLGINITDLIK